jgi:xylan 1,4-beta-xylosidase
MPEEMAEKKEYVFWWRMNISSAKSMYEWYSLVEAFVRHVTERYGEEEVKKWYFEVWNEPNLSSFFTENKNRDAYFELYDNAARAVKSVCEDYSVGGPVTAGSYWVDEMIAHCRECKVPLDFISTHEYCVHGYFDSDGESQVTLLPTTRLIERVCEVGTRCRKEGFPLLLTEWSTSYTSRDPIHDSYISAPFILEALKGCDGAADMMSYWVYTDIFEEVSPPYGMFHGGFGLMTVQSVKKTSYYAYRFLAALGDTEIVCADESCYVCKNEDEIQVLLWNYKKHEQGEKSNSSYYSKDIPSKSIESVKLELCGLEPNAPYSISIETIGYKMGDCYGAYLEMGAPKELTREETESLKERSKPKLALVSVCSDENGGLELEIPQTENQADLVRIAKKK